MTKLSREAGGLGEFSDEGANDNEAVEVVEDDSTDESTTAPEHDETESEAPTE